MGQQALRSSAAESGWLPKALPQDEGFTTDLETGLDQAVAEKRIWNVHGLVVTRNGKVVLERYFKGEDRARGHGALGGVAFGPDTLHDLRSCSKSVVGLLYGIALDRGLVPPPETALFSAFPEYAGLAGSDGRDRLTIHHALTMSMGTDWDETSLVYSDPRNSETAMDAAPDRYRYILGRAVIDTPGTHWRYCGGATALLARILAKGTGQTLHAFAREALFEPLGIGTTEWAVGVDGEPFAASGARMTTRDLARIGLMMLDGGRANGRAVVPAAWLDRCVTPYVSADEVRRYGYQWFVRDVAFGPPKGWAPGRLERLWMAQGEGGQRLFVLPALRLVIAVTAGNYERPDQWMPPTRILNDVVLAHVR
ncbi:MAG: serine hydrolase [Parafilimonas terrae]|nr:serine hydrolase [Parafilimonas terrae]